MRQAVKIRSLQWSAEWNTDQDGPEVELYAFGMSPAADETELDVIASPLPDHVIVLPSHSSFELFTRALHQGNLTFYFVLYEISF